MTQDEIGGYFSLELKEGISYHKSSNCLALNTARNCLEYILKLNAFDVIYLPYFTCEVIMEPVRKLNLEYRYYSIDENLEPVFNYGIINENEVFLYTNYFGMKDDSVQKLASIGINLIVDNAQSFFSKPIDGIDTFYSARKFFGVSDGAYLYTGNKVRLDMESDISYHRMGHLLKRLDTNAENGYGDFCENDDSLKGHAIKKMSNITRKILDSIDYDFVKSRRLRNFHFLHDELKVSNQFSFISEGDQVPMIYPYWTKDLSLKKRLQEHRIYCPTYWLNVKKWCGPRSLENRFVDEVVYLPIDQRYNEHSLNEIFKYV